MSKNVGFAISVTYDEPAYVMVGNVQETAKSSLLTEDVAHIERRVLVFLSGFFDGEASDQGHDSDGDLIGDLSVEANLDVIEKSIELDEPLSTSSGTLPMSDRALFTDLNYPDIYSVSVSFFNLQDDTEGGFKSNSADGLSKLLADIRSVGASFFDKEALVRNISSLKPESWDDVEHFAVLDFINEDLPLADSCKALLKSMGVDVPADLDVNWEVDVLPVISDLIGIKNVSVAYIDGGLAIIYTGTEPELTESLG